MILAGARTAQKGAHGFQWPLPTGGKMRNRRTIVSRNASRIKNHNSDQASQSAPALSRSTPRVAARVDLTPSAEFRVVLATFSPSTSARNRRARPLRIPAAGQPVTGLSGDTAGPAIN